MGNIPPKVTESMLADIFSNLGPVEGCKLKKKEKVGAPWALPFPPPTPPSPFPPGPRGGVQAQEEGDGGCILGLCFPLSKLKRKNKVWAQAPGLAPPPFYTPLPPSPSSECVGLLLG